MFRIVRALYHSLQGISAALRYETAFRQEFVLLILIGVLAWQVAGTFIQWALIMASWLWVMIVELINSGLEALCDQITLEKTSKIKLAKDYGSAAVMLSIGIHLAVWGIVLFLGGQVP